MTDAKRKEMKAKFIKNGRMTKKAGYKFTVGKHYDIKHMSHNGMFVVRDDDDFEMWAGGKYEDEWGTFKLIKDNNV